MPAVAVLFTPLSRRVPGVFTHDVPEVNATAFEQASLAGCANETTEQMMLKKTNNAPFKERLCIFFFIGGYKDSLSERSRGKNDKNQIAERSINHIANTRSVNYYDDFSISPAD